MKARLIESLARLASAKYQDRFLVHGNGNNYVVAEDMLESALSNLQQALDVPVMSAQFSDSERESLRACLGQIEATSIPPPDVTNQELVHEDRGWRAMRGACTKALSVLQFDLASWERHELE